MKTKTLRKKLILAKETVSHLDSRSMEDIKAGNAPLTLCDCSDMFCQTDGDCTSYVTYGTGCM